MVKEGPRTVRVYQPAGSWVIAKIGKSFFSESLFRNGRFLYQIPTDGSSPG